jgi:hypothetical protein
MPLTANDWPLFNKKLDAWKRGEFNVTERGESQYTAFREVYIADCIAAGFTTKQAEDALKAKVIERLGKDTKATFANFIEATAIEYAEGGEMNRDEAREALEAYYAKESDRRAKEREPRSRSRCRRSTWPRSRKPPSNIGQLAPPPVFRDWRRGFFLTLSAAAHEGRHAAGEIFPAGQLR